MAHILVAEDEVHILLLIQRKLESAGYTVSTIADGDEALRMALENKYDLLLLDVMLPGCEVLDICRLVKDKFGTDAPPVILMSARGQQIDVEAGQEAGADDYIIKPFSPRQLLEHVEAIFG
jgi:DNA-binding response OmpR family regulator